jgi:hypothetical protein
LWKIFHNKKGWSNKPLADFADLEISLHQKDGGDYFAEVRFSTPKNDVENRVAEPIDVKLDLITLQDMIYDPAEYGKMLSESLFADTDMRDGWIKAKTTAQSQSLALRVRLLIGPSAPELSAVYWETLRDPEDNSPLSTSERIFISRYLASSDWRPVKLRSKGALRALAAAANPSDLESSKLAPVDVSGELGRAKEALGSIPVTELPGDKSERCTLNNIIAKLRDGYDILYLAAHGALNDKGEPNLWLEDDEGKAAKINGNEFATRLKELENQPRLIILASCQSAGKGNGQALQALGPKLSQAGVPAVIAMQGSISLESIKKFMPVFFAELEKDGQIDRALGVARGTIRDAQDFWMPVLFMRLKSGSIWYVPGFGGQEAEFQKWNSLAGSIMRGQCTPILGSGLTDPIFGTWRDIAERWAEKFRFPLAPSQRDAFSAVAEFLAVDQDLNTLNNELDSSIREALHTHFPDLPPNLLSPFTPLQNIISEAGKRARANDASEQHKVLARLPLPIYITTNVDDLLSDALKEANKNPQVVICQWSDRFYAPSVYDTNRDFRPDANNPLVYHLMGHLSVPDSMVLTEDDYFEFLIGFTNKKKVSPPVIPSSILAALTNSALLFLGFQLDDWSFRVIFRLIMSQQGGDLRVKYSHIGVQVAPDESHNIDPRRAQKYLENYFKGAAINIYWGYSNDFLRQLNQQLPPAP